MDEESRARRSDCGHTVQVDPVFFSMTLRSKEKKAWGAKTYLQRKTVHAIPLCPFLSYPAASFIQETLA